MSLSGGTQQWLLALLRLLEAAVEDQQTILIARKAQAARVVEAMQTQAVMPALEPLTRAEAAVARVVRSEAQTRAATAAPVSSS